MCSEVLFDVPPGDFAACEAQLREAGILPEVKERQIVDDTFKSGPSREEISGTLTFRGEGYDFHWLDGVREAGLIVGGAADGRSANHALLEILHRLFPERPVLPPLFVASAPGELIQIKVPEGDFAPCEARLREGGWQPEVRERRIEIGNLQGFLPREQIFGTLTFRGKTYDFGWGPRDGEDELVIRWLDDDPETRDALRDELQQLFPRRSIFSAADLKAAEKPRVPRWWLVGCALWNIALALVVYRVFIWLRSS